MLILLYYALVALTMEAHIRALVRVSRQNCFEINDNALYTLSNKIVPILSYPTAVHTAYILRYIPVRTVVRTVVP